MASYIFLRWVLVVIYSSQIPNFHDIVQLPTLKNFRFDRFLTVLSAAVRKCIHSHARRKMQDAFEFLVTASWMHSDNMQKHRKICTVCVLRLTSHGRLWEYDKNRNFLTLGAALFHENVGFAKNIWVVRARACDWGDELFQMEVVSNVQNSSSTNVCGVAVHEGEKSTFKSPRMRQPSKTSMLMDNIASVSLFQ